MENDLLIIGTFIIAISLIVGIAITSQKTRESNQLTRESNDLIKKELDVKLRPWIKINDIKYTHAVLKNGRSVGWNDTISQGMDRSELKTAIMSLSLENIGKIPTEKLYVKISHFERLTKEEYGNWAKQITWHILRFLEKNCLLRLK